MDFFCLRKADTSGKRYRFGFIIVIVQVRSCFKIVGCVKGKASIGFKSGAYTQYMSILNRIETQPARHRGPLRRGGRAIGRKMQF